ncbi:ABC transporter, partial [Pseudomonas aeruginosa]
SAFPPDRRKQGQGLTDSANIHVLLVADTDLLSNPLWLQEQPGHNEPQVWADNDLFGGNALDYLSSSAALNNLRSRGPTKRTFTQEQLNALQQSLNDTDKNLRDRQKSMDDGGQEVTPEMEAKLRSFSDDKWSIRQQRRQLQFQMNADVERLAEQGKLANKVLHPALLTLLLILIGSWR